MSRLSKVDRKTKETDMSVSLVIDGTGKTDIDTGIPFFNHMLNSFARHGRFDLEVKAKGDLDVGPHHTVEDVGILLGKVFKEAIGDGRGIERFSEAIIPMDEAAVTALVDISGRPYLVYSLPLSASVEGVLEPFLVKHFFESFVSNAYITLHIGGYGLSDHHICEAAFKATGIALRRALFISDVNGAVPSTKGTL